MNGPSIPIPIYYFKLLIFGLLPLFLSFIDIAVWYSICYFKGKNFTELRSKFTSTLVVLLFLVHPNIANVMFLAFNCMQVDDDIRLKENIASICYQGDHLRFMILMIIPSCILWIVGIPLFALMLLYQNR